MAEPRRPIDETDLHAYVDGALAADRRDAVEEHLAARPDDAARVAAWREQNAALHAVFDPVLDAPLPASMRKGGRIAWLVPAAQAAAALLLLLVGGAGGWWLHAESARPASGALSDFAGRAAVAHAVYAPEVLHPVEVPAAQQAHLVGWLSKRLGVPLQAPDLAARGFTLVGGRLLPGAGSPAAQFMYQNHLGKRVTIYLRVDARDNRETAFQWLQDGDLIVCYWLDGPVGYAVAGSLPWSEIEEIARIVYDQIG